MITVVKIPIVAITIGVFTSYVLARTDPPNLETATPSLINQNMDYKIVSGHLPPWSFNDGSGIHADIVAEIEKRIGSNKTVKYQPWSRAQRTALDYGNYIIFPLTNNKEREDLYQWVVPVMSAEFQFVTYGGKPVDIEQAKTLKVVLCAQNTPPHMWLKTNGFTNIKTTVIAPLVALRMLRAGRGDAWLSNKTVAQYSSTIDDSLRGKFVFGPPVFQSKSYIAFTKKFPPIIIEKYKNAFAEIKADGTYKKIIKKYLKENYPR